MNHSASAVTNLTRAQLDDRFCIRKARVQQLGEITNELVHELICRKETK